MVVGEVVMMGMNPCVTGMTPWVPLQVIMVGAVFLCKSEHWFTRMNEGGHKLDR